MRWQDKTEDKTEENKPLKEKTHETRSEWIPRLSSSSIMPFMASSSLVTASLIEAFVRQGLHIMLSGCWARDSFLVIQN